MSVSVSSSQLDHFNSLLSGLEPQQIIQWAVLTFPNLFQTTAFGLTGLVSTDMISKLPQSKDGHAIDLIFLDTLYHFDETMDLVARVQSKYPSSKIHVFKPDGFAQRSDFEEFYGKSLWDTNDDLYDYLVKVEPAQRAYKELDAVAVLTGRRKSQGDARDTLKIVELEEETGLIKINPLANWSFQQVRKYIEDNDVPYNSLLDKGYRSVGDFHSTVPVKEGENERAGRWKGKQKTECGIHQQQRFAQFVGNQVKAV